jgi:hypothetical protein
MYFTYRERELYPRVQQKGGGTHMPNHKNIFRNKVDFAREEFATELYKPNGRPRAREYRSQKSQLHMQDLTHKSIKRKMRDKTGLAEIDR